jgi:hypothetical protein
MYGSTYFGRPHAHHQELNNCSSSLWFYRWSVVVAVLLVVVGHIPISKQNTTLHSLFIPENCATCFGWYLYPSSGAHTTVSTASGICHTVTARLRLKCDGTRAETRFRLTAKRTSPFKSAGASGQSTTGKRTVHISLQGLYCTCKPVFCSHVTLTGYPLHSLVSPSHPLPCVTVYHHISTGFYMPLS